MSAAPEGRFFRVAIVVSLLGHAALPFLPGADRVLAAEAPMEEREAREPMTVRIVLPDPVVPVPAEPTPVERVMTSDAGTRSIQALDLEPLDLEPLRRTPDAPTRQVVTPTPLEPDPVTPTEPLERVAATPPPPVPIPIEREPLPAPTRTERTVDVALEGPKEIEEQSAATVVRKAAASSTARNRPPTYPRSARARRLEGTCEVLVSVSAKGAVTELAVQTSSGHSILDKAAIAAVRRWTFDPAVGTDGAPMADTVLVPVTFRIKDR